MLQTRRSVDRLRAPSLLQPGIRLLPPTRRSHSMVSSRPDRPLAWSYNPTQTPFICCQYRRDITGLCRMKQGPL